MKEIAHTITTPRRTFEEGYVSAAVAALSLWLRGKVTRILLGGFVTALTLTLLAVYFLLLRQASSAMPEAWRL